VGGFRSEKELRLLNWKKIMKTKEMGGLGLRDARSHYQAKIGKLIWGMKTNGDTIWARTLTVKYGNRNSAMERKIGFVTWKAIKWASPLVDKGIGKVVSNGETTNFWTDNWSGLGCVKNFVYGPLFWGEDNLIIKEFIQGNGQVSYQLPQRVIDASFTLPFQMSKESGGSLTWWPSKDGNFSIESGYELARDDSSDGRNCTRI